MCDNMVSVIIVEYKTYDRCFKFIQDFLNASDIKELSFVIVDNSPEKSNGIQLISLLKSTGCIEKSKLDKKNNILLEGTNSKIAYIFSEKNVGFAKANNLGLKYAMDLFKPDYILFSNSDIRLPATLKLSILVNDLDKDDGIGIVGPKIVGLDGRDQSPGKYVNIFKRHIIPELFWPLNKIIPGLKSINADIIQDAPLGRYYRIIGAFMLCKTSAICKIGGFDSNTFLYAEEPILSEKFYEISMTVLYDPRVRIIHEQGVSTNDRKLKSGINLINKRKRSFDSEFYYYGHYMRNNKIILVLSKAVFRLYIWKLNVVLKIQGRI